jgi:hypothetical protein
MRWRNIITGALLLGLLGFKGQFLVDFFYWGAIGRSIGSSCGQLETMYDVFYPDIYDDIRLEHFRHFAFTTNSREKLIYQLSLLFWLTYRGELAIRTGVIVAFLGTSFVLGADQLQQNREAKRLATVS